MKRRILVVDDRAERLAQVAEHLGSAPLSVTAARTTDEALQHLASADTPFDVALLEQVRSRGTHDGPERRTSGHDRRGNAVLELLAAIHARSDVTNLLLVSPLGTNGPHAALRSEAFSPLGGFSPEQIADLLDARLPRRGHSDAEVARRLGQLLRVAATVSSSLELDDVLQGACRAARDLLRVTHACIALFTVDLTKGTVQAEYPSLGVRGSPVPVLDVPVARRAIESGQVIEVSGSVIPGQLGAIACGIDVRRLASMLVAPIAVRGRVFGCVALSRISAPRRFGFEDRVVCEGIAALVGVAVENARLYRETRRRADQLERLRRAAAALTKQVDQEELVGHIVREAVELVGASGGGVYRYDAAAGTLTVIADHNRKHHRGKTLRVGEGLAGELVQTQRLYIEERDYGRSPKRAAGVYDTEAFGSVLEVLLTWEHHTTGVLYVDDAPGRVFSEEDIHVLLLHAEAAAMALARVTPEAQRGSDRTGGLRDMTPINAATGIVDDLGFTALDQRLTEIASHAADLLDAESAGVFLVAEPGVLSLEASYGHAEGHFEKGKRLLIRPNAGLTGHIAQEGRPFRAHGDALTTHPAVVNPFPAHLKFGRCCSLMALPLFTREHGERRLKAVLRLENKRGPDRRPSPSIGFTEADEEALQLFGEFVTIAITNGELIAELRQKQQHAERRSELAARLRDAMGRLQPEEDPRKLYRDVVREASHLIGASAACLYANHAQRQQVELLAAVGLPPAYAPGHVETYAAFDLVAQAARQREGCKVLVPGRHPGCEVGGQLFQTVMVAPLRRGATVDRLILVAGNSAHHPFADIEFEIVQQFAAFATTLFERSAFRSSQPKALERSQALRQFKDYVSSKASTQEHLLAALATGATAGYALGFNRAAVLLTEDSSDVLTGALAVGDLDESRARQAWNEDVLCTASLYLQHLETAGHVRTPLDQRIRALRLDLGLAPEFRRLLGQASRDGSALLETAAQITALPEDLILALDGTRSPVARPLVLVPLRASGTMLGLLVVDNLFNPGDEVPREHIEALVNLSSRAAEALRGLRTRAGGLVMPAESIKPPQITLKELDRQTIANELDDLRRQVVMNARRFLGASSAVLWCYDHTGRTWSIKGWDGVGRELQSSFEQKPPSPGHTADTVIKAGWLAVPRLDDRTATPFLPDDTRELLERIGASSFQAVSILIGSEVLGVLYVNYPEPREFSDADRAEAMSIARDSALMLRMAETISELNSANEQLRALFGVASLGLLLSKWEHRVSDRVSMAKHLLLKAERGEHRAASFGRALEVLDQLVQPPRLQGLFEGVTEVDMVGLLGEMTGKIEETWRSEGLGLTLSTGRLARVRANPEWLAIALMHFISNSQNALRLRDGSASDRRLSIGVDASSGRVSVTFADTGPGIPEEVLRTIFVAPPERTSPGNFGVGLMTARTILVAYGGDAHVLRSDGHGTTIAAWLPEALDASA